MTDKKHNAIRLMLSKLRDTTTFHTIVLTAVKNNITIEELLCYLDSDLDKRVDMIRAGSERAVEEKKKISYLRKEHTQPNERASVRFTCNQCGSALVTVKPVNVSRCTNVGGGYKSSIECSKCGFSELSKKSCTGIIRGLTK